MCTSQVFEDDSSPHSVISSSSSESLQQRHQQATGSSLHSNFSFSESSSKLLDRCGSSPLSSQEQLFHCTKNHNYDACQSKCLRKSSITTSDDTSGQNDPFYYLLHSFIHENYRKAAKFLLPIIIMRMNIVFDNFLCIVTLFLIRYAATKWIISSKNENKKKMTKKIEHHDSSNELDESLSSSSHSPTHKKSMVSTVSDDMLMGCSTLSSDSSSMYDMRSSCHESDCNDDYDIINYEESYHTNNSNFSRSQKAQSSFIPFEDDLVSDEWGHFTDFEMDTEETRTLGDPFRSITKTMLRKSGHKVSLCKLEQLQEGDEGEEDGW